MKLDELEIKKPQIIEDRVKVLYFNWHIKTCNLVQFAESKCISFFYLTDTAAT